MEGAKWIEIRNDYTKGLSYTEIAKKYHIYPRTDKNYALSETKPFYSLKNPKPLKLDSYKNQICIWLDEAPYSASKILEKLKEQGFNGQDTIVKKYVPARRSKWMKSDSAV